MTYMEEIEVVLERHEQEIVTAIIGIVFIWKGVTMSYQQYIKS